jgi:ferric-dicitrate binding protein FerR (iron transport regulator)
VTVIATAIVAVYVYLSTTQRPPDTFATRRGEHKEIVLSDSSKVILNYASRLVVPKQPAGQPRRVSLTGEAYFRIQPSETPFIVSTEYAGVQVVGTEFNLRARGGALGVAVIAGVVEVSVVKDGKDSSLLFSRNQMGLVPQNEFPRRTGDIPSADYPGWMHGKLFLDRTPFLAAVREVEMRFDVSIKTDSQLVRSDIITGILDARTAETAVAALCELTGRRFTHEGQEFHVY